MTVDDVYEVSKQETQKSLLLDTANLVQDPVSLYSNEHIENAVHFSINKVDLSH